MTIWKHCIVVTKGKSLWSVGFLFSILFLVLLGHGCFATMSIPPRQPYISQKGWIVSAKQAKQILANDKAHLIDVRSKKAYQKGHIKGAVHTTWQTFSEPKAPYQGRLLKDDNQLNQKLQALGLNQETPILVYGNPVIGWGEEGRIVWMLRTFGHKKAMVVDGGFAALTTLQGMETTTKETQPTQGNFRVKRTNRWSIDKEGLRKQVAAHMYPSKATLIDTRERREYKGQTPYGETRGGHVPGAQHLYFKDLIDSQGRILSRETLLERLKKRGIVTNKPVVAYCTGGIRSGWFVILLLDIGFSDVKNYAGSMWEWASSPAKDYPLVTENK